VRKRVAGALPALVWTMLLSGLWHGASFAFICWGLFFGIGMVLERKYNLATKVSTPYHLGRNLRTAVLIVLSMRTVLHHGPAPQPGHLPGPAGLQRLRLAGAVRARRLADGHGLCPGGVRPADPGRDQQRALLAGNKDGYFMRHVGVLHSLLLWAGLLALSSLAANSFSPFLYFQF
jgi:alginate O-acetyltransferase complex protein AlgI